MPKVLSAVSAFAPVIGEPVTLTDAASVLVPANKGSYFRLLFTATVGNTRTIAAPTGLTDGQSLLFELTQDATGSRTVTWASGTGGYSWGADVPVPVLSTAAGKADYVLFKYVASAGVLRGISVARGY